MFKRVLATILSVTVAVTPATAIQAAHKGYLYPAAGYVTSQENDLVSVELADDIIMDALNASVTK